MLSNVQSNTDITVLITGAGGSATANVIDSLSRADTKYFVIGADASALRLHLSQASERCVVPLATNPRFIESLNLASNRFGCQVLHVQPDPEVRRVSKDRHEIASRFFLPPDAAVQLAGDKGQFAVVMASAGVSVPESINFDTEESITEKTTEMLSRHERVWIRARVGAGARASLPVSRADQARAWIGWWTTEKGMRVSDFMASEMLPGREYAFQSVWQDGKLIVGQTRERVEYLYGFLAPSGQSSTPAVARTVKEQKVDDAAIRAVLALCPEPNGVFCVDIKCSVSGEPKVTEINAGRFFTTSNFFAAAGINMPDMAMRAALGEKLHPIGTSPLSPNLYWVRMVDMGYQLVAEHQIDRWLQI